MATKEFHRLASTALALPTRQRVELAQALWNSLDAPGSEDSMTEIRRRDADITRGKVRCKTHAQVMKAARKAINAQGRLSSRG